MSTEEHMRRAIALSLDMVRSGKGGPFGAVVVHDGKIIAEGCNQVTSGNDVAYFGGAGGPSAPPKAKAPKAPGKAPAEGGGGGEVQKAELVAAGDCEIIARDRQVVTACGQGQGGIAEIRAVGA